MERLNAENHFKSGFYLLIGSGSREAVQALPAGSGSREAAQEWAEKHLDGSEYEEIFGAVEEDESKKVVTFSLPESIIEQIKQGAQARRITLSDYVAEAVKAYK